MGAGEWLREEVRSGDAGARGSVIHGAERVRGRSGVEAGRGRVRAVRKGGSREWERGCAGVLEGSAGNI